MRKVFFVFLLAILFLPAAGLAAQEGAYSLLSFDIGYGPVVNVSTGTLNTIQSFGINVRVAGPLTIGAITQSGVTPTGMLKAKFDVLPTVRAVIGYGSGNAVGLGFEAIPFKRGVSGLFTEFKLAVDYFFTGTTIGSGNLAFGLVLGVGF